MARGNLRQLRLLIPYRKPNAVMNSAERARRTFHLYMETAKKRRLTDSEKAHLAKARQALRRARRPAMNSTKPSREKPTASGAGRRHHRTLRHARRRRATTNPAGLVRMGRLVELRYDRDHGKHPGYYKHVFKSRPTLYFDPRRNLILVKGGR